MRVAGADAGGGQWVVVSLLNGAFERVERVASLAEVLLPINDLAALGVDIPIGLPRMGSDRECDRRARREVGTLTSSVFPAPPRRLLMRLNVNEANAEARRRGVPGVSSQTFALKRAILSAERVARQDPRVHEVHPEVSFVEANGGPLNVSKRTWNGQQLRRRILRRVGIEVPDDVGDGGLAGSDDVLDAAIAAWTAHRLATGIARRLPEEERGVGTIWV